MNLPSCSPPMTASSHRRTIICSNYLSRTHSEWVAPETARPEVPSLCCSIPTSSSFVISRQARPRPRVHQRRGPSATSSSRHSPSAIPRNPCSLMPPFPGDTWQSDPPSSKPACSSPFGDSHIEDLASINFSIFLLSLTSFGCYLRCLACRSEG